MTPTLRRLNDRERYWGLTWPGWVAVAVGGGILYAAVELSPLSVKATITIVVLALTFCGAVLAGISGQALSPSRHLRALSAYHRHPKRLALQDGGDRRGLVLTHTPDLPRSAADLPPVAAGGLLDGVELSEVGP